MAQITRNMCDDIIKAFEGQSDYPITAWEKAQLAYAWPEREDVRDARPKAPPAMMELLMEFQRAYAGFASVNAQYIPTYFDPAQFTEDQSGKSPQVGAGQP